MKPSLSQLYLTQAKRCRDAASQASLANVRQKIEQAEASWRAMAVLALEREAEHPDRKPTRDAEASPAAPPPRPPEAGAPPRAANNEDPAMSAAPDDAEDDARARGHPDTQAGTGPGGDGAAEASGGDGGEPGSAGAGKDPEIPVEQAFGIDGRHLYQPSEEEGLGPAAERAN